MSKIIAPISCLMFFNASFNSSDLIIVYDLVHTITSGISSYIFTTDISRWFINKMVSKRLDKWRRDISEKRRKRKSKRYYIPMKRFNLKPPQKKDGKTKMFHISSPYFLHLFFRFSLNFPNVKNSNCFHHRSTDVCKHTGKGKTFYSNEFFLCKNTWISCTASASTDPRLRLCGTQTHLFSVATKVYDVKCFSL